MLALSESYAAIEIIVQVHFKAIVWEDNIRLESLWYSYTKNMKWKRIGETILVYTLKGWLQRSFKS